MQTLRGDNMAQNMHKSVHGSASGAFRRYGGLFHFVAFVYFFACLFALLFRWVHVTRSGCFIKLTNRPSLPKTTKVIPARWCSGAFTDYLESIYKELLDKGG